MSVFSFITTFSGVILKCWFVKTCLKKCCYLKLVRVPLKSNFHNEPYFILYNLNFNLIICFLSNTTYWVWSWPQFLNSSKGAQNEELMLLLKKKAWVLFVLYHGHVFPFLSLHIPLYRRSWRVGRQIDKLRDFMLEAAKQKFGVFVICLGIILTPFHTYSRSN